MPRSSARRSNRGGATPRTGESERKPDGGQPLSSTMPEATPTSPAARWILAIEASNPSADPDPGMASVAGALIGPDGALGEPIEIAFLAASRKADGLLPAIEAVRSALAVTPQSLSRVCVSVGPGGYTGLRVSVTVAKTIAMATGADLVPVSSAAVAIGDHRPPCPFVVCLASKGDRTHATAFQSGSGEPGRSLGVIDAAVIPEIGGDLVVADRFLPEPIRVACLQNSRKIVEPRFSASRCMKIGSGLSPVAPAALVPDYAREPEAVRLWRARRDLDA